MSFCFGILCPLVRCVNDSSDFSICSNNIIGCSLKSEWESDLNVNSSVHVGGLRVYVGRK